jgi:hypothetical protein
MLYADAPFGFKTAMFREASALGASSIRLDVFVPAIITGRDGQRDWSTLDEYVALARQYHVQVLGVLLGTPGWLAHCPAGTSFLEIYKCSLSDPAAFATYAAEIAAHARGVIDDWEILNEPDGRWAYLGTAADYARLLTLAARAIHVANPAARVLLGGVMSLESRPWLRAVFAIGGRRLVTSVDVTSVHVRCRLASLRPTIRRWRAFFARRGLRVPLWVTEHGYPSDPRYRNDPRFQDGAPGQAAYLRRSVPAMLHAGVARVFVTERDNLGGAFASEGLLGGTVADPPVPAPVLVLKPAAATFAGLAGGFESLRARPRA